MMMKINMCSIPTFLILSYAGILCQASPARTTSSPPLTDTSPTLPVENDISTSSWTASKEQLVTESEDSNEILTAADDDSSHVDLTTDPDTVDPQLVYNSSDAEILSTSEPGMSVTFSQPSHPCRRPCIEGAPPMTCRFEFNVEWYYAMSKACYNCRKNATDCYRPECVTANGVKRPLITVNRLMPGPSVEVCLGDHVIVDVANHLMDETTSVHWHGHHQRGSPYMDGVPFISQCPISPNSVFRYDYRADNPGTHFWHSHTGVQRGDGAFGSFIIRTPSTLDPHTALYDADLSEHVILVLDWSHQLGMAMFTAHYHSDGDNKPQSMIVNGRGRYFNDTIAVTKTPLAEFTVKKGLRYRFRLINAGVQNCPIDLTIDNHTMTVISSDGSDIKPKTVDSLVSYAGERWDFVLNADAEVGNYWMRFTGLMDCDERFTKAHQLAILHYKGAPTEEPVGPIGYNVHLRRDLQLNALNVALQKEGTLSVPHLEAVDETYDAALKPEADQQVYIAYDFYPKDNPHYHKSKLYGFSEVNKKERVYTPQFNDISMKFPHFPLLSQYNNINQDTFCDHQKLSNCNSTFCQCTNIVNVPLGNVVEIIIIDKGVTYNANHPFHLHGHPFRVIGMDRLGETIDVEKVKELDRANMLVRNFTHPPIKDTITVPDGGYTILRVHASNPGYWLFHCHIEFHVEVGMALIFKVGEHSDFTPIPKNFPKCGDYYSGDDNHHHSSTEIDFHHGQPIDYNITVGEMSQDDSLISFTHWWHSFNGSFTTSSAERNYLSSLVILIVATALSLVLS
uniref:Laccase 1 isoform G n=1 Tax=Nephotettix cincticeps TaxID=94400 RepID=D5MRE2_NEPCI|nr:laccase 1 isoform G [Nephotettix cincticeps]